MQDRRSATRYTAGLYSALTILVATLIGLLVHASLGAQAVI